MLSAPRSCHTASAALPRRCAAKLVIVLRQVAKVPLPASSSTRRFLGFAELLIETLRFQQVPRVALCRLGQRGEAGLDHLLRHALRRRVFLVLLLSLRLASLLRLRLRQGHLQHALAAHGARVEDALEHAVPDHLVEEVGGVTAELVVERGRAQQGQAGAHRARRDGEVGELQRRKPVGGDDVRVAVVHVVHSHVRPSDDGEHDGAVPLHPASIVEERSALLPAAHLHGRPGVQPLLRPELLHHLVDLLQVPAPIIEVQRELGGVRNVRNADQAGAGRDLQRAGAAHGDFLGLRGLLFLFRGLGVEEVKALLLLRGRLHRASQRDDGRLGQVVLGVALVELRQALLEQPLRVGFRIALAHDGQGADGDSVPVHLRDDDLDVPLIQVLPRIRLGLVSQRLGGAAARSARGLGDAQRADPEHQSEPLPRDDDLEHAAVEHMLHPRPEAARLAPELGLHALGSARISSEVLDGGGGGQSAGVDPLLGLAGRLLGGHQGVEVRGSLVRVLLSAAHDLRQSFADEHGRHVLHPGALPHEHRAEPALLGVTGAGVLDLAFIFDGDRHGSPDHAGPERFLGLHGPWLVRTAGPAVAQPGRPEAGQGDALLLLATLAVRHAHEDGVSALDFHHQSVEPPLARDGGRRPPAPDPQLLALRRGLGLPHGGGRVGPREADGPVRDAAEAVLEQLHRDVAFRVEHCTHEVAVAIQALQHHIQLPLQQAHLGEVLRLSGVGLGLRDAAAVAHHRSCRARAVGLGSRGLGGRRRRRGGGTHVDPRTGDSRQEEANGGQGCGILTSSLQEDQPEGRAAAHVVHQSAGGLALELLKDGLGVGLPIHGYKGAILRGRLLEHPALVLLGGRAEHHQLLVNGGHLAFAAVLLHPAPALRRHELLHMIAGVADHHGAEAALDGLHGVLDGEVHRLADEQFPQILARLPRKRVSGAFVGGPGQLGRDETAKGQLHLRRRAVARTAH
mmetsp:Transcript_19369/g.73231  ORF Transcript_19369/g.73231 Transcript_19369/m.73231 type:complete len:965 (+) Transcript_19369:235-3129(+)